jgi:hypothetical protein
LSESEKKPYYNAVEQDRQRHDQELQSLLTKGFFINKKGEKSSDLKPKVPRKRLASDEDLPAAKKLKK